MQNSARGAVATAIWIILATVMIGPVLVATTSPYLAYRNTAYIIGGFAGIISLSLLLIQPLLAAGYLPGARAITGRKWHRWVGTAIVVCVGLHVGGLYVTSPPDTQDALLLVSPTAFSVYGVLAMWGIVLTVALVILRHRMGLRYATWRLVHNGLAAIVVAATVTHALQIEGAMETVSKWGLCIAVVAATGATLIDLRLIRPFFAPKGGWINGDPNARKQKAGDEPPA
ncbi:ferric reductase-like transmembrane domain-containing protein [Hoeflea sp. WL0058]|uniref:Ferric reductase-like transmembrane domain-containing protein n=1 Tax=Flavimaribacter sediminis TaxID=2865987 RepID=A0AAE2ZMX0_9HYPH|nr:ferric reductase-like transmembrane domain-containing protein [Flavimaribacter sediminis]MBW8637450.1 ferric reductase-like transmembrane domain-containing protein [Flavimaribacter sediminis]